MNTNPTPDALADRLRTLYAEVAALWGFTIPEGPLDGIHAAALEAMMRAVKEDRASAATRLEALQAQPVALPLLSSAFRTTVSGAGGYSMHFKFPTMAALHAADDEWIKFRKDGQCTDGFAKSADGSTPSEATSASITTADAAALTASPPVVEREAIALALLNESRRFSGLPLLAGLNGLQPHQYRDQLRYADAILALTPVAQGDEVRGARTEYGWLIERDSRDGLRYATPRSWTVDHMKALRFARKIDAGAFAASRQDWSTDIRITEHAWD